MKAARSLRLRLVLIVVGLLAAVSLVVGAVSVLVLRSYLIEQLDQELRSASHRSVSALLGPGSPPAGDGFDTPGQNARTVLAVVSDGRVEAAGYVDSDGTFRTLSAAAQIEVVRISADGSPVTADLGDELGDYRMMAETRAGYTFVTGLPLSSVEGTTGRFVVIGLVVLFVGLVLGGVAAAFIVAAALRPLRRVAHTAASVAALPLDRSDVEIDVRVPERDTDPSTEVGQVGSALNRLLGSVGTALAVRSASEERMRRFVADASHELRTPLASIRGYAELTRRTQPDLADDVQHNLGRIESESVRMTSLVEDLLLLARLDTSRELEHGEVDLSLAVLEAVGDAHAAGPDHEWHIDLPEEPVVIDGDEPRLRQVIVNLLANARVHTPAGTRVTTSLTAGEGDTVTIRVADDGPGIDPVVADKLFERFSRGDASRTRATGSTGLGLSIVKTVVEAHGGTVAVASEPGDTVFVVTLPQSGGERAQA